MRLNRKPLDIIKKVLYTKNRKKEKQEKKLFEFIDEVNNHGRLCGVRDFCFHEITRLCEILGYKHNLGLFKIDNK